MIFFGSIRFFTSIARWALHVLSFPLNRFNDPLLLAPPFLKNQFIYLPNREADSKVIKFICNSYFDWATIFEIFAREEYSLKKFPHFDSLRDHAAGMKTKNVELLVIDLGANVGAAALFLRYEWPDTTVICVEPSRENCLAISRNTEGVPRIEIKRAAIGPVSGELEVRDLGVGNNAFRTFGAGKIIERVEQLTVQSLVEEHSNADLFMVKIDIEGFESELFSENTSWIDKAKVIAIETHDWMLPGKGVSQNLINALAGRNRDLVFQGENLFSIRND